MKIIPNRNMRLGGEHLARAVPADVTDADGAHAIRHGWAVAAPVQTPARAKEKPATTESAAPRAAD